MSRPRRRPSVNKLFLVPWVRAREDLKPFNAATIEDYEEYWSAETYRESRELERDWPEVMSLVFRPRELGSVENQVEGQVKRAVSNGAEGDLSPNEWRAWVREFDGCCAYCMMKIPRAAIEHVVPICQGGDTSLFNVVPACRNCNSAKGRRSVEEWLKGIDLEIFLARVLAAGERLEARASAA